MQRIAMFLAILGVGTAAALTGGCKNPPTQSEMAAYDYGPRPENHEKLIRDYLWPKLLDPGNAIVEFKAGPKQLFQQETALRPLRYGWGVCVWINDKNTSGAYDGPYPMVFFIRDRSEEHTSELQSHSDLVCRLLLEKKKQKKNKPHID